MLIAIQIIGGLFLLFAGGEVLIRGAVSLAKNVGLSTFVIGLTVVAYGTSSPELIISVQSALEGHTGLALGNIIGSNISNILCVIGLTAIVSPIAIDKKAANFDSIFLLGITILLFALCNLGIINYISGIIFYSILILYTLFIFKKAKKEKQTLTSESVDEEETHIKIKLNLWQACIACFAGLILLMLGSDILIKGAINLATIFGISESVIGLTIVAFGTSVPELVTSVVAAYHKRAEIVLGNIIGSNIFNILGVLGGTSLVSTLEVTEQFLTLNIPILLITTIIMSGIIFFKPTISRKTGGIFFASYLLYVIIQF